MEPLSILSKIKELRYLPDDSSTIQYIMDSDGITVLEEKYSTFSIRGFKENLNNPISPPGWLPYRLYTFDGSGQLVKFAELTSSTGKPRRVENNIYEDNRLVRKESTSFWLDADGTVIFNYPLWLTKRLYDYDNQNRTVMETDSVYITHDIAKGSVVVIQTEPRLAYITITHNSYNDRNELIERKTVSTKNNLLTYSNGWNAFSATNPGKVYNGITTFSYSYDKSNQLVTKKSQFKDFATTKVYESVFAYSYAEYVF